MGNFVGHLSYHRFKPLVTIVCILVWDCYLRIGASGMLARRGLRPQLPKGVDFDAALYISHFAD